MQRKAIEYLLSWRKKSNRKPLIIRGARQVGKTWLMKEFGRQYYSHTAYINFDGNQRMKDLFEPDYDLKRILEGLSIEAGQQITEETLLLFDEVQECPKALAALKYFYEQRPQQPIIAAGSLLGVALHQGTSFPVGKVEFMDLYPLSFEEFMEAMGESRLLQLLLEKNFDLIKTFADKYIYLLRQYYFVGGMPEVVSLFAENRDYQQVRQLQNDILTAYEQDFSKHASPSTVTRIREVWHSIPSQLSKENKKFIYGAIRNGARAKEYELALEWLQDCGLIYRVYCITKPSLPLSGYQEIAAFKLFMSDVGLLSAMSKLEAKTLLEGNQVFTEFKGALTEQYVLQELKMLQNPDIYYWVSERKAEIDFVIQTQGQIVPIEAKAANNLQAKSLKVYQEKYTPSVSVRFSMADYKQTNDLYDIPLYMVEQFPEIIKP